MWTLCGFGENTPSGSSSTADFSGATGEGLAISPVRAERLSSVTREQLAISTVRVEGSSRDSSKFCGRSIIRGRLRGRNVTLKNGGIELFISSGRRAVVETTC